MAEFERRTLNYTDSLDKFLAEKDPMMLNYRNKALKTIRDIRNGYKKKLRSGKKSTADEENAIPNVAARK